MKHVTFYLDVVSPYAYLAFEQLPDALSGHSYAVSYKPVLLAALLKHHGQPSPADLPGKRAWIERHVRWLARQQAFDLQLPAQHPFSPLALLRLALACCDFGCPNRYVMETVFRHVWQGGGDAADPERWLALSERLAPKRDVNDELARAQLRANTDDALALGVFGVPAFEVDGKLFFGLDALPLLKAYLAGDTWFENAWDAADQVRNGS
jgi:2-hydroxychromene-2-carboxylate isomerase